MTQHDDKTTKKFFIQSIKKVGAKRKHLITNSYGSKLAWRWIKKNKWLNIKTPISEKLFGTVIREIHLQFIEELLRGKDIILPKNMGRIELKKRVPIMKLEKGKIKTNLPIDWARTLDYWYADKRAFKDKKLIRCELKYVYIIKYNKRIATYKNKDYYYFIPNREFKKLLSRKIKNNEIDAFIINYGIH